MNLSTSEVAGRLGAPKGLTMKLLQFLTGVGLVRVVGVAPSAGRGRGEHVYAVNESMPGELHRLVAALVVEETHGG